jgi:hypothetical protein
MNADPRGSIVVGIYVAGTARAATTSLPAARLEAGRGIVGDRYHSGSGTFSPEEMDPAHQLTLIAEEEILVFNEVTGQSLDPGAFRRNVVTRGVDLNALVGVRFKLGEMVITGVRLCEPCSHLAGLVNPEVLKRMVHRAGLRAEIVTGGVLRPGDPIEIT